MRNMARRQTNLFIPCTMADTTDVSAAFDDGRYTLVSNDNVRGYEIADPDGVVPR